MTFRRNKRFRGNGEVVKIKCEKTMFDCELLHSYVQKLKGLEFKERDNRSYMFFDCNSIHTFGMKENIDVAFVSDFADVIEIYMNVGPNRLLKNKRAGAVIERFASDEPWLTKGEIYWFDYREGDEEF